MSPGPLASDVPASLPRIGLVARNAPGYGASKKSKKYPSPSQEHFPFKARGHLNKEQLLS